MLKIIHGPEPFEPRSLSSFKAKRCREERNVPPKGLPISPEVRENDTYNYLVLPVPMPAECETVATPEEPMLLLAIDVEPAMLGEMLLEMDELPPTAGPTPRGLPPLSIHNAAQKNLIGT